MSDPWAAEPTAPPLRVASVPAADAYVDAIRPPGVVRIGPDGAAGRWLDADHLAAHADEIDVLHVHAGYEHLPVAGLERWTETLQRLGIPLVVTVHQVREPDRAGHDAHLAALLAGAEVVFTLTPGAADAVADRHGRTAIVVAHPSVAVPVPELGSERGLVGLVLRHLPPAVPDPGALVRATLSGVLSGGGRLRVLLGVPADAVPGLAWLADDGALELVVPGPDDEAWTAALQQLHVAVLAEPCGAHSRDLEICRDVGTRVVAPGCGWVAGQWNDVVPYRRDHEQGLDPVSLSGAVGAALARPLPRPADRRWREQQRAAVQRVHAQVYTSLAADRAGVRRRCNARVGQVAATERARRSSSRGTSPSASTG